MSTKRVLDRIRRWKLESPFLWTLASGFRSFLDNETSLRASALTYYTALATIPVLAILFGISRGFGILDDFDAMAKERFSEHQQVYEFASNAAQKLLQNASGGVITSVAILFLLWTVINILSQVETELNRIWHSHRQRSVMRRVMDYTALIILLPLLTVLGSGFTMWVLHSTGSWVTQLGLRVLPVSASCIVIFLSYFFLPCKRVSFSASALAALIAGLAYQAVQYIFIRFQVGVTTYNTLYGSFAAIPLFLVWVQVSWTIFLAGAELGYAWEHRSQRRALARAARMTRRERSTWAVLIAALCAKRFKRGEDSPTKQELVSRTGLAEAVIEDVLDDLIKAKVLGRLSDEEGHYIPARPVSELRVSDVLLGVIGTDGKGRDEAKLAAVSGVIASFWDTITRHESNVLLLDLDVD